MDDNYIWSIDRRHFQHMLNELGERLPQRGLHLHPGKTDIIHTATKPVVFEVAGERVPTKGPDHIFHVLGSPLSLRGGTAMLLAEAQSRARKAFWTVGNPLHPMQPSVRSSRFTWCWCDRVPSGLARPGPAIAACREQSMSYSFRMFVLCWASAGKPVKSGLHGTSAASVEAASRSFTAGEPAGRHSCCLRYGPLSDIFAGGPDRGKDLPMAQLAMVARAERW